MGKKRQIIYTDDEGAVTSNDSRQYVEDEGIVLYRTRGHPEFAERARVSMRSRKTGCGSNKKCCGSKKTGPWVRKKGLVVKTKGL